MDAFQLEPAAAAALNHFWRLAGEWPRDEAAALWSTYRNADPLVSALVICIAISSYCFFMGAVTGNYSKVDQLWSLLPIGYATHFAYSRNFTDTRLNVMAALVALWGLRLTFNFWRKGGYNGEEDYRWPVLRRTWPLTHPMAWQLFNLLFIAFYQNILLLLISLPSYAAYLHRSVAFGGHPLDYVAAGLMVVFVALETAADQQQWEFQTEKYAKRAGRQRLTGDFQRGFLTQGLFRYSRHPNFFAEQCVWWSLYLFVVSVTGRWLHWTIVGPVLLSLLFQGSTAFTEYITVGKYPAYRAYQQTTSRLVPWLPGLPLDGPARKAKTR